MIPKEKVLDVIKRNNNSAVETTEQREGTGNYQWSQSRIALCEDIVKLSDDELLDLLALMDYGRELTQKKAVPNHSDYKKFRQQIVANISHLNEEIKKEKAIYLLKNRDFSSWLCETLPLFNIEQFEF